MKKNLIILSLIAVAILTGCSCNNKKLSDEKLKEIENQVSDRWNEFSKTVINSDAEAFAKFISDDMEVMFSGGAAFYSKAEYIDNVRVWFGGRKSVEMKEAVVKIMVLSENVVAVDQTSDFIIHFKDGTEQSVKHAVSFLFRKEGTEWMIFHGHESIK